MKLNEFLTESEIKQLHHLEEGPIGAIGTAVGKGVGAVARGAGAVAGGVAGIGSAFKKGFQTGRATVAGEPDPNAKVATPKASSTASTSTNTSTSAGSGAQKSTDQKASQPVELKPGQPVTYVNDKGQTKQATFVKNLATQDAQGDPQIQVKSKNATFAIDRDRVQTGKPATQQPTTSQDAATGTTGSDSQQTSQPASNPASGPTASQDAGATAEPKVGQSAILAKLQQQVDKLTPDQQMQVLKTVKADIDKTAAASKLPPAKAGRRTTKPAPKTAAPKTAPKPRARKTTKPAVTV